MVSIKPQAREMTAQEKEHMQTPVIFPSNLLSVSVLHLGSDLDHDIPNSHWANLTLSLTPSYALPSTNSLAQPLFPA